MPTLRTALAKIARALGLSTMVENPRFRKATHAPLYRRHVEAGRVGAVSEETPPTPQGSRPASLPSRSLKPTEPLKPPILSVVVPAYNVQAYLRECLDSICKQTYRDLEIIVVDDGSSDKTLLIADQCRQRDSRIRVISQDNRGLGAARNTGLRESVGRYVAFVDSDDVVPEAAYETMIRVIEKSQSDVVIGAVERFDSKNRWVPEWVKTVHSEDRIGTTGREFPPIMWDVFAWNKLFRRSSWDNYAQEFPEGVLYEDQECTAKFYVRGARLDILASTVYLWRLRDDGSSITQQKTSPEDLRQRLEVARRVEKIVLEAEDEYRIAWYAKLLGEDLFYYIREAPRADSEFWELLSAGVRSFWEDAPPEAISSMMPVRRWLAFLSAEGRREELEDLLVFRELHGERCALRFDGEVWRAEVPIGASIPAPLNTISTETFEARTLLEAVNCGPDGSFVYEGVSCVDGVDAPHELRAYLRLVTQANSDDTPLQIPVSAEVIAYPRANMLVNHAVADYTSCGIRLTLAPSVFESMATHASGAVESDHWRIVIEHLLPGGNVISSTAQRRPESPAGLARFGATSVGGTRGVVKGAARSPLEFIAVSPRYLLDSFEIQSDGTYAISVVSGGNLPGASAAQLEDGRARLVIESSKLRIAEATIHWDGTRGVATGVLPEEWLLGDEFSHEFVISVVDGHGRRAAVALRDAGAAGGANGRYSLGASGYGFAMLTSSSLCAQVNEVALGDDGRRLVVSGDYYANAARFRTVAPTFALVGRALNIPAAQTTIDSDAGSFGVEFDLTRLDADQNVVSQPSGKYVLQVLLPTGAKHAPSLWVRNTDELHQSAAGRTLRASHSDVELLSSEGVRGLIVKISAVGASRDNLANARISRGRSIGRLSRDLQDAVFFECFGGQAVSDSPKAIDAAVSDCFPNYRRIWSVRDSSIGVPAGAEAVVRYSEDWYQALGSSRIVVSNSLVDFGFRKAEGQKYLQTWHGTPLKRIAEDIPAKNLSLSYRQASRREAASQWDLLLAQSSWAERVLSSAFRYPGETLAVGYPRNDVLTASGASEWRREMVRRYLGIGSTQKVVLYAPTWRDNMRESSGHYKRVDFLEVRRTARELGPQYKILFRSHSNGASANPGSYGPSVVDVSTYPDINDLILASDVLVTDYSSVMFDYVVTGKPMIFHVPDFDQYSSSTRGMYLDFGKLAPGPLSRTRQEVVSLLGSDDFGAKSHADRYFAFARRFAPNDDGQASARVVEAVSDWFV